MHILLALKTAFSLWMLIDAGKRQAPQYWYFIILMPFGALAYFFCVKIHDREFQKLKKQVLSKPVSLEELEYRAKNSPSANNRINLAHAYYDSGRYPDAIEQLEAVLKNDKKNKTALHSLGLCQLKLGERQAGIETLKTLIEIDFGYDDYSAGADLVTAQWEAGACEEAVDLLQKICKKDGRIQHHVMLARYLTQLKRPGEAKSLLEQALADYEHSPAYIQKNQRNWAKEAKQLLRGLSS